MLFLFLTIKVGNPPALINEIAWIVKAVSVADGSKTGTLIINEVAWMGTKTSPADEWIELYNNSNNLLVLDGWLLKAADGTPEINLSGTIPAKSYYLLERTDDKAVTDVAADKVYTGALSNNGELLELYNKSNDLIDFVDCLSGWLAGSNKTKQTMEKVDSKGWQNSHNPEGTPRAENSMVADLETEALFGNEYQPPPSKEAMSENYPNGLIINEICPSPEGPDSQEEWIEIFNQNSFKVNLSGWKISDKEGVVKTYTFPMGTIIEPKQFLVLYRPTTKITLNNSLDGLTFVRPNGIIIDSLNYEKAPRGQSFNKIESGWSWSNILTPGAQNITTVQGLEIENKESLKEGAEKTFPKKQNENYRELAAISQQISKENFSFFLLLIASALAFLSGFLMLFLKNKIKFKI